MARKVANRMREIAIMEKWLMKQDQLIDYLDVSKALDLPISSTRKYLIDCIRKGTISDERVAYTIDGKNFKDEDIVHLHLKNPKAPGRKCNRCV